MSISARLVLVVAGTLAACSHAPPRVVPALEPEVARDLERIRTVTAPFKDLAAAQKVGYPTSTPRCLSDPMAGGMGHHYVNRDHVDGTLDLDHPEILLYAPTPGGRQKLVAVEYIIPYRILPPESTAPRIMGQELRRSEELKLWYLHVWAWEENPAGLFADWNPAVKCNPER
jgi:hypothetical protein